jgi:hypothetical protein
MSDEPKIGVNRGNAGKGRPKGAPNKLTKALKDAILEASERAGGQGGTVAYLQTQAIANPTAFLSLLGKVLPMQVTGPDDAEGNPTELVLRIIDVRTDG